MEDSDQLKKNIASAASEALKVIANAASEATKVVAQATASAQKVSEEKYSRDHDLIIELKVTLEGIKEMFKDLNSGLVAKTISLESMINKQEIRINSLDLSRGRQILLTSIGTGLLGLLCSLLTYHLIAQ